MNKIKKSVIVPHSAKTMFDLVADIKNYPKYLPWCSEAKILNETENEVTGAVYIEYFKIKTHFATKNINTPYSRIEMSFMDGPFKYFQGQWGFLQLGENGCKIDFNLTYQFSNIILEKAFGPVFSYITKNIVDCFIKEANKRHGNT
jgi:ribosome-associated toxin RatA of RatAB toxin-antitoxin module